MYAFEDRVLEDLRKQKWTWTSIFRMDFVVVYRLSERQVEFSAFGYEKKCYLRVLFEIPIYFMYYEITNYLLTNENGF